MYVYNIIFFVFTFRSPLRENPIRPNNSLGKVEGLVSGEMTQWTGWMKMVYNVCIRSPLLSNKPRVCAITQIMG